MIRVVLFFIVLAGLAYGGMLLVQNPGHVTLTWHGEVVNAPAALLLIAIAVAAIMLWSLLRFVLGLPSAARFFARQRRREKGYSAGSPSTPGALGLSSARSAASPRSKIS